MMQNKGKCFRRGKKSSQIHSCQFGASCHIFKCWSVDYHHNLRRPKQWSDIYVTCFISKDTRFYTHFCAVLYLFSWKAFKYALIGLDKQTLRFVSVQKLHFINKPWEEFTGVTRVTTSPGLGCDLLVPAGLKLDRLDRQGGVETPVSFQMKR